MKFSDLKFEPHPHLLGATQATHLFANQWTVSVVTGHEAFYTSAEKPYEVAIFTPDGDYLNGDVFSEQTKEDIEAILEVISKDDIDEKAIKEKFISDSDDFLERSIDAMQSLAKMV